MNSKRIAVISDFDGTITERDSLNYLLNVYGPPDWEGFENRYEAGEISGSEALETEMSLLDLSIEEAIEIVTKEISIRDDFPPFVKFCEDNGIPLTIVSCNFRQIIGPILRKHSLDHIPFRSSEITEKEGKLKIISGTGRHPVCSECHECKALTVIEFRKKGFFTVYLGDGLTDRCPAWEADLVFARGRLKKSFDKKGIDNFTLDGFGDLAKFLNKMLRGEIELRSVREKSQRDGGKNPFAPLLSVMEVGSD